MPTDHKQQVNWVFMEGLDERLATQNGPPLLPLFCLIAVHVPLRLMREFAERCIVPTPLVRFQPVLYAEGLN